MITKEESGLKFEFCDDVNVVKFDDTKYYRKLFNSLPGSKGVDFIAVGKNNIAFIEVKNCTGDEGSCRWRISPNNKKRDNSHTQMDLEGRDSLDIEVSQKVAMTFAALLGAKSFDKIKESVKELDEIQKVVFSDEFSKVEKKKYVILFLEGDFGSSTRTKKMIMLDLQKSMIRKLKWFNCKVSVVDSDTYSDKIFHIV